MVKEPIPLRCAESARHGQESALAHATASGCQLREGVKFDKDSHHSANAARRHVGRRLDLAGAQANDILLLTTRGADKGGRGALAGCARGQERHTLDGRPRGAQPCHLLLGRCL